MVVQIPSMGVIFMGCCMAGQVSNMISSVMYKSKLSMWDIILRRVLMIPCEILLRTQLRNTSIIALLGSGRGIVGVIGGSL